MQDFIDNQYQNMFICAALIMAFGGAWYFAGSMNISVYMAFVGTIVSGVAMFYKRLPMIVRAITIAVFGFCYAATFTYAINTPIMPRDMRDAEIRGTVTNIDFTTDKVRLYIDVNANDLHAGTGRATIRLSGTDNLEHVNIGDTVNVTAGLYKPSTAFAPETFDYARWAYFNGLTATGYIKDINIISHTEKRDLNNLRHAIHMHANSFLVDSLVLGYKNSVPNDDAKIWTSAGVGHIWSISGFHMTLVGAWIFAIFYLLFRSIPYITRRTSARIPAMCMSGLGLMIYLILSGTDIATIRAFIMTALVYAAFIIGRNAISLRNVAIAFCILFIMNPHNVMQAGFQLSFAAVFGLVWMLSVVRPTMPRNKLLRWIYGYALTSIVAMIFTAPFIAIHFGMIPTYSLIGNMVLLPIFSFVIMPLVILGATTAQFGLRAPIDLANMCYDFTLDIARWIADLPYANIVMPHISNTALMFMILGLACMILIRPIKVKVNYILCAIMCVIGVALVAVAPRPIFMATHDHELVAFRGNDGNLEFNKSRASNHYFAFDTWKQINGENVATPNKRRKHEDGIYRYGDLVYVQKIKPLVNNLEKFCKDDNVKYIVSYFDIQSPSCAHKILRGGFIMYPGGLVRYIHANKPWNQK